MIKKILVLLLITSTLFIHAQERCGTKLIIKKMMEENPEYKAAKKKVNTQTERWIKNYPNYSEKTIIIIPVVVHVVWKTNAQNISNAQIQSQIEILNNDYRRSNIDQINTPSVWQGVAADCEIEFCLANTDPNGNATSGITRTETTVSQFSIFGGSSVENTSSGGIDAWPNDDYLNLWVCNLGNGLLGYATPPTSWISSNDGVVINYTNFGNSGSSNAPYHKGRTATHEVGHWLNLEHIWGDNNCGNDQISDTPKHEEENYGCLSFPHASSCSGSGANGEMFMNYMDYTNDQCMNLFTEGQKTRMLSAINQYRSNMLSHNLCSSSTSILEPERSLQNKKLVKIMDVLGREINQSITNTLLYYMYDDGSIEKKVIIE
ncbi:zinc metalloprotease [Flavobacteriales bacterium]|nr:zinc metalloprotease [Flavobacteriales bacterium]